MPLLLTFSWFAVPAELQADGGEQVPDELLNLLVEVGVGQQWGQHAQVAAEVAPHRVVGLVDERLHQPQHLHRADHPCTRLDTPNSMRTTSPRLWGIRASVCWAQWRLLTTWRSFCTGYCPGTKCTRTHFTTLLLTGASLTQENNMFALRDRRRKTTVCCWSDCLSMWAGLHTQPAGMSSDGQKSSGSGSKTAVVHSALLLQGSCYI